jgi:hypothetical protein
MTSRRISVPVVTPSIFVRLRNAQRLCWGALFACLVAPAGMSAEIAINNFAALGISVVRISGDFIAEDGNAFQNAIVGLQRTTVVLESEGGNLLSGIQIGTLMRLRGMTAVVPHRGNCASACALAWLGGIERQMGADARIGFHAASTRENGELRETGVGNALVGAYLNRIGLSDAAVIYITSAAPRSMTWLTLDAARSIGIDVKPYTGKAVAALSEDRGKAAPEGRYHSVQIAVAPTEGSAWEAIHEMQARFPKILHGFAGHVVPAEVDARQVYRARFLAPSQREGEDTCRALKERGARCFIVRHN